jgi:hypothetical protein
MTLAEANSLIVDLSHVKIDKFGVRDYNIQELGKTLCKPDVLRASVNALLATKPESVLAFAVNYDHLEQLAEQIEERTGKPVTRITTRNPWKPTGKLVVSGVYLASAMVASGMVLPKTEMLAILRPTLNPVLQQSMLRHARPNQHFFQISARTVAFEPPPQDPFSL